MKFNIFGIRIDKVNSGNISKKIITLVNQKTKKIIFYINAHTINIIQDDHGFVSILNKADLTYCGGLGPVIAANLLKKIKLSKTTTPDFIFEIFSYMEKSKKSVYFLGGKDEDLSKMIFNLKEKFPKLKIAGFNNGYFLDDKSVIRLINKAKPDMLLVGMGSPKQEKWIVDNYKNINAGVFWSVGAIFEILSGKYKRLPKIFNDYGFEWIFRLVQEPKRLWKRYLIGNLEYLHILIREYIKQI